MSKIDAAVAALKEALAGTDVEKIKAKSEELTKILQDVGTAIYQQAAAEYQRQQAQSGAQQGQQPPQGGQQAQDKKVYDADFKVG